MEFDVLRSDRVLLPNMHLRSEEGVLLFWTADQQSEWRTRPRPVGHYTSTVWIPGNFLSEGTILVEAVMSTPEPVTVHFHEQNAVAFHITDTLDGDSARGDYGGHIPGAVRPLLDWTTEYEPACDLHQWFAAE